MVIIKGMGITQIWSKLLLSIIMFPYKAFTVLVM